jgi:hypothetical protein
MKLQVIAKGGAVLPNAVYYITKCLVPALQRVLGLAGADVGQWWCETARDTRSKSAAAVAVNQEVCGASMESRSELARISGQFTRAAGEQQQQQQREKQQRQQQQQRKIDNYMQSDMCCVCRLNQAQVKRAD